MDDDLKFALIVYLPILALGWLVAFLDWVERRKDRRTHKHKPA